MNMTIRFIFDLKLQILMLNENNKKKEAEQVKPAA